MLDRNFIINNKEDFIAKLKLKTSDEELLKKAQSLISTIAERKIQISLVDQLKSDFNKRTENFRMSVKSLGEDEALKAKSELSIFKQEIEKESLRLELLQYREDSLLMEIPNLPSVSSPVGTSDKDNPVVFQHLENLAIKKSFTHDQIGNKLGILSGEDGAKLSGSRFTVLYGAAARLERSLINFFLDLHTSSGYEEVMTPYIVTREVMTGTGQLPKFEEDLFAIKSKLSNQDAFLIPTAEVPVTNIYRDMILDDSSLPIKHCCFSPCFRAEAGSAGRDTKGLIRLHQFHKVELVIISREEDSPHLLDAITSDAKRCLEALGLPYRVVERCSADLGFGGHKGYDLEVWMAGQGEYREISSCTSFSDFQARRSKIRYKGKDGKNIFAHTLNASGLAIGRTMAAILEFYQDGDNVNIPDVLIPYFGSRKLI
jgi:seryl-tRNA synthetase